MIPDDRTREVSEPLAGAGLSDWQKQQLAERLAEVERDPGGLLPASEVEAELRALLAQSNPA
ncbi:MAG: hypothetical protein QOJ16_1942 [Acidobacteriota bacterium]|jgi:predicted subunit of tRNA(5-methylaminomethyl-2-thiouridylate) methyltransferase|nr:hypothetical protein [Acidobacteriota bacterium]